VSPGFGRNRLHDLRAEAGSFTARADGLHLRWSGPKVVRAHGQTLEGQLTVSEGDSCDLVLEFSRDPLREPAPDPQRLWERTEQAWKKQVPSLRLSTARRDAEHSYAVLRGLTTSGGGMVAAATTSLPERAEAGRNYDYRYVWIRDQCYAGNAAADMGGSIFPDALRFVSERLLADGPNLRPAYTHDGKPLPNERDLSLPGYPGADGVKAGNHAGKQFQLDAFGECLLLLGQAARRERLDRDGWRAAKIAADAIERRRHQPDSGVWELEPRLWTHSRLICAAGLKGIAGVAADRAEQDRWRSLADTVAAEVGRTAVSGKGPWKRAPDDDRIDASLLVPAIRGAVMPGDPRTRATVQAVRAELTEDGYVYRFRPDERPVGEAEGAFLLCSFWMSLASLEQGDRLGAVRWFERGRSGCGPPGLFSEEFDVRQRQMRGNLPQAFVHALMLECAAALDAAGVGWETEDIRDASN
jgi:GH15 family glucan-1,4-alpha-glucosidase